MTTDLDTLILRYLRDLEAELGDLPAGRRQELLDEVQEHIAAARADLEPETEAGVRSVLERLGDPADIAAEARERFGVPGPPARPATRWLEVAAIVLLVIPPLVGWVVGVVLVWTSRLWTTRDKLIGTLGGLSWLLAPLGTILSARPSTPVGSPGVGPPPELTQVTPSGPGPIQLVLFSLPYLLPFAAAIYLGIRLRRLAARPLS
jgi:hypothetical protein